MEITSPKGIFRMILIYKQLAKKGLSWTESEKTGFSWVDEVWKRQLDNPIGPTADDGRRLALSSISFGGREFQGAGTPPRVANRYPVDDLPGKMLLLKQTDCRDPSQAQAIIYSTC